jgi:hypothetical protein
MSSQFRRFDNLSPCPPSLGKGRGDVFKRDFVPLYALEDGKGYASLLLSSV